MRNLILSVAIIVALGIGVPALAQQLHPPSLPTSYIAASDDPTNGIARAEQASYEQFQQAVASGAAQTPNDGRVVVPWGDWLAQLLSAFALAIGAAVSAVAVKVFGGAVQADRLRQYTQSAVNYAINLVDGAVAGQTLSVPVANQVLERALEYSVDMFPSLVNRFGGTDAQRQRIVAALSVQGAMASPARTMTGVIAAPPPASPPPPPASPT